MRRNFLKWWITLLVVALGALALWQHFDFPWPWRTDPNSPRELKRQRLRPINMGPVWCAGKFASQPEHPSIKLERAEFVSPATITPGSLLEVRAYTNQPVRNCCMEMQVCICSPGQYQDVLEAMDAERGMDELYMWDDGKDGDAVAHDGEWYGALRVNLHQDCVFAGMAEISFHDYSRQCIFIENQVRFDVPEDDAWAQFDASQDGAKNADRTAEEAEAGAGVDGEEGGNG